MVSDAHRAGNKRWDAENMLTLSVRLRKEVVQQFRQKAEENGTTANALLKNFILDYIEKASD